MANKEFKIQSNTFSLNGVPLTSSADGKVVIPGITRASSYQVDEVEEIDEEQTTTWTEGIIEVIDNAFYQQLLSPDLSLPIGWSPAAYQVELEDDGYIDDISVTFPGALWNELNVTNATSGTMWASAVVPNEYDFNNFDPDDWTAIPFIVTVTASSVESEFEGGNGSPSVECRFIFYTDIESKL